MNHVVHYFIACATMTVLWMALLGALAVVIIAIIGVAEWGWGARALRWVLAGAATLAVVLPSMTTLYAFWGQW